MSIVLDYAPDGAIIGGSFYSNVPEGAVESGMWQVVHPGAIYARQVHIVDQAAPVHGFLGAMGNGQMGVKGTGGQGVVQGGGERGGETPDAALPPLNPGNRTRSPSPPPTKSPKRRRLSAVPSLEVTLPIAVDIEETSGAATIANTANRNKRNTPRASQISHVGHYFTNRRALLFRGDKPYTCNLCGTSFAHPVDVKAHFNGHPDIPGRACWAKQGARAGVVWNGHPSCRVSEADLKTARCKEGWVIVDQESWSKINAAAEEGRKFREGRREDGDDVDGGEAMGLDGAKDTMRVESEEASPGKKKEPPKRKVVRAGDETETDVGGHKK